MNLAQGGQEAVEQALNSRSEFASFNAIALETLHKLAIFAARRHALCPFGDGAPSTHRP
jgi:hypothetical protein